MDETLQRLSAMLGDTRMRLEPLIEALKDEEYCVRVDAVMALGKLNDTRAVGPLIQALNMRMMSTMGLST